MPSTLVISNVHTEGARYVQSSLVDLLPKQTLTSVTVLRPSHGGDLFKDGFELGLGLGLDVIESNFNLLAQRPVLNKHGPFPFDD